MAEGAAIMIRLIIKIPVGEGVHTVSPEAAAAIQSANGRWASPMPGTQEHGGAFIADAIADNATPELVEQLAPGWVVLAAITEDGTIVRPIDMQAFRPFLSPVPSISWDEPPSVVYNDPPSGLPHNWSGWHAMDH